MGNHLNAAKQPKRTGNIQVEGSETIPNGSTLLKEFNIGSASPRPGNAEGGDIVQEIYLLYFLRLHTSATQEIHQR